MKNKSFKIQFLTAAAVFIICIGTSYGQNRNKSAEVQGTKKYDVAAFVRPSYHPDDRAKIFWPMGIGEWETVMKNKA